MSIDDPTAARAAAARRARAHGPTLAFLFFF
jgi:hypothetical protein